MMTEQCPLSAKDKSLVFSGPKSFIIERVLKGWCCAIVVERGGEMEGGNKHSFLSRRLDQHSAELTRL